MATTNSTTGKSITYSRLDHDYHAEFEGVLVGFFPTYLAAETALNEYAYDLLSRTAADTADALADAIAEQAAELSTEAPLLVEPSGRTYTCFVDDCAATPTHMYGGVQLCCQHYGEYRGEPCKCRTIRRPVEDCAALLAEADAALQGCPDCGTAHHIQRCPAIRALLLAPEERVPAFAAPVAEPWGCEPWMEAA